MDKNWGIVMILIQAILILSVIILIILISKSSIVNSSLSLKNFSFFRFFVVFVFFSLLVIFGYKYFGYVYNEASSFYEPTYDYLIFIKFLPKYLVIVFLVWMKSKKFKYHPVKIDNKKKFILESISLIILLNIMFIIIKEVVGWFLVSQIIKENPDLANIALFYLCSVPSILLVTYFQFVNAKYIVLFFKNVFREEV